KGKEGSYTSAFVKDATEGQLSAYAAAADFSPNSMKAFRIDLLEKFRNDPEGLAKANKILESTVQTSGGVGKPIDLSAYAGRQDDHQVLRTITDEVMRSLQELSGQEYVDEYAAARKAAIAERAEALVAAARAESAAAAARAEEMVAAARAETERARIKAEELMAIARAETTSAFGRAEDLVAAAKARARGKRDASVEGEAAPDRADVEPTLAGDACVGREAPVDPSPDAATVHTPHPPREP
ncbi:MAG: hypothetical protein Q4P32_04695, partial [Micrococcales bacterium]|nr:hypothetical protein [Micrococcales bacterium]